jgi:uncharacterized protein
MEPRISIITLGVSDLPRSIAFYRDGLGLPLESADDHIAFFELQGTRLALYPMDALADDARVSSERSGFSGITLAQCVRTREDVDALLMAADTAGAKIVKTPRDVFWGGYSGYFSDPDGHLWEIAWNPFYTFE